MRSISKSTGCFLLIDREKYRSPSLYCVNISNTITLDKTVYKVVINQGSKCLIKNGILLIRKAEIKLGESRSDEYSKVFMF